MSLTLILSSSCWRSAAAFAHWVSAEHPCWRHLVHPEKQPDSDGHKQLRTHRTSPGKVLTHNTKVKYQEAVFTSRKEMLNDTPTAGFFQWCEDLCISKTTKGFPPSSPFFLMSEKRVWNFPCGRWGWKERWWFSTTEPRQKKRLSER